MGVVQGYWLSGPWNANKWTLTEGSYTFVVCLWNAEEAVLVHRFVESIDMLVAIFEKDGSPSCTIPGCSNACLVEPEDTPIVGCDRTCACSYALAYSQCTATSNLALAKRAKPPDGTLVRQLG